MIYSKETHFLGNLAAFFAEICTAHSISRFYHEVETAVGMLEKKNMWVN